jgi:hypothetical protein
MDDLIERLERLATFPLKWDAPDLSAAKDAIAALRAYAEREKELVEALDCLTSNVEHAWPALANLGPVANARAILDKHKAPA